MSNFIKSQAKRKRELAKLDKRQAKEQKRAERKAADRSSTDGLAPALATAVQPATPSRPLSPAPPPERKPLTLAEAAERWKNLKVAKPGKR